MNPLNINQIKVEKANSIKLRYQKLRKISNIFRVFEIFLVVAVISRLSFQSPLAMIKLSNEYIHKLSLFIISPQFVFIIGNAIVIVLFVNSGQLNTQINVKTTKLNTKKQGITEENTIMATIFSSSPDFKVVQKNYRRSKSDKLRRVKIERNYCELKRSKTEIKSLKGSSGCYKDSKDGYFPEDHMSNEEFRKTIEDFIAKQQRLLREEEFCVFESDFEL